MKKDLIKPKITTAWRSHNQKEIERRLRRFKQIYADKNKNLILDRIYRIKQDEKIIKLILLILSGFYIDFIG